ncbi:MBL fold metallo-hydrolase, partial [Mesorhizobium sp.]|uniref:MBL fold metallo-hydrolase n=1 Tax=Mesorhizobium sp. TaxID=1871066 RepID=UPI0025BF11A3
MTLEFDTRFDPAYGQAVTVAPDVLRITAPNPSPFTFHGTNSYLVGRDTLAVIDPGPDDDEHLETLLATIGDRPVSHIFVSHTHRDHSALAARLKERTGALVLAEGPHRPARRLRIGEVNPLDASA